MDLAAAKNKHNQSQFHGQIKNHPNGWPNNEGKNEKRATKNSVMRQHGAQTLQAGFRALNIVVLPIHFRMPLDKHTENRFTCHWPPAKTLHDVSMDMLTFVSVKID
jgi:hypothetical protein